jgi:hypothetical protein
VRGRVRQLLYRPRRGLGWPLWVDAPAFDLADHVRVHPLAAPGDEAQLLQACAQLYRRRLDPARPLWEVWFLPGLPGVPGLSHPGQRDAGCRGAVYAGQLNLTAVVDRVTCADVGVFTQGVRSTLTELARSVLVPAS